MRGTSLISKVGSVGLAAAVILMTAQVILRFVFNAPQAWAEEVDRYIFVWSVFLGSIIALAKDSHIRVTFVVSRLGPKFEAFSPRFAKIICVISYGYVSYYGFLLAFANRSSRFYTVDFMPQMIVYLSVPISLTIMVIYLFCQRRKDNN